MPKGCPTSLMFPKEVGSKTQVIFSSLVNGVWLGWLGVAIGLTPFFNLGTAAGFGSKCAFHSFTRAALWESSREDQPVRSWYQAWGREAKFDFSAGDSLG